MSDGRLLGKLKDGKYGIRGLTIVILIEAVIRKYVKNIQKPAMNIGKPSYICMMSIQMLHSSSI